MSVRETEFKFLLSEAEYVLIHHALGPPVKERAFINRYFTVLPAVERKDWVLRLRLEGESKELTLKIGRELSPGVFDSLEYNEMVTDEKTSGWGRTVPVQKFQEAISEHPLRVQGEARNCRLIFHAPIEVGVMWELDRSELPGGLIFRELEVEVEYRSVEDLEKRKGLVLDWLGGLGVEPKPSEKTKYARFLAALGSVPS